MEITGEGLVLGAGTVLAKMGQDHGAGKLDLEDEQRLAALLATAYERPLSPYVLAKARRAAELWNAGEKALAHIHLAFAALPPCGDRDQALRLFVADELLKAGVPPATLMQAQGFDPAPLDLLKFNPAQPRVPAGNGRESGQWTGGEASIAPVAFRGRREKGGHRRGGGGFHPIHEFLDWLRGRSKEPAAAEELGGPKAVEPETSLFVR